MYISESTLKVESLQEIDLGNLKVNNVSSLSSHSLQIFTILVKEQLDSYTNMIGKQLKLCVQIISTTTPSHLFIIGNNVSPLSSYPLQIFTILVKEQPDSCTNMICKQLKLCIHRICPNKSKAETNIMLMLLLMLIP